MPLGLMPGMEYEEVVATLLPGEVMLLSSDGIVEAHDPDGEMFGFAMVRETIGGAQDDDVIGHLLEGFDTFVGLAHDPEDDITLVSIRRTAGAAASAAVFSAGPVTVITEFAVPSVEGNERKVMETVSAAVAQLGLPADRLDRLKTAVSEAAMNAIEHGNGADPSLDVGVRVESRGVDLVVAISDHGDDAEIPAAEVPDLEAKLAGEQRARGWGLFLIEQMVDEVHTHRDGERHVVELVMRQQEA
jgi:anti-sigma regulatory factor (Ser/Thr protein kinase)